MKGKEMRILFQGDSITDVDRNRNNEKVAEYGFPQVLGSGYPQLVSAKLGFEFPKKYEFINRGISGNRVADLLGRMQSDIIKLKPDVISILIGVNDVWHEWLNGNGINAKLYEEIYHLLIREIKKELPNVRIMILEPFVLQGAATAENYEKFREEVLLRAEAARRVAEKNHLEFIPLQAKFEEALKLAPENYWLGDGVHPTSAGHELIAREWLNQFQKQR